MPVFILIAHGMFFVRKRKAKVGMWRKGTSLETPGQYKKRAKQGVGPEVTDEVVEASEEEESWFQLKVKSVFG